MVFVDIMAWYFICSLLIKFDLTIAFSALMQLVGRQKEHLACKKLSDEVLVWLPVWSKVQMISIWSS